MPRLRQIVQMTAVLAIATILIQSTSAQGNRDIPGAIQLKNGLILRGVCGSSNTIDPLLQDQRLELRRIDQRYRTYFVSTRRSNPVAADALAVPGQQFTIIQHRVSQRPMNYAIGLHNQSPFQPDGTAFFDLILGNGETTKIEIGIIAVNSQFATVDGLTHNWQFAVATSQIPEATLYAGLNQPSLLRSAKGFDDGETRLNMARMLLDAEKYNAAKLMTTDIANQFPDLQARCERQTEMWNDAVGQRVLVELGRLHETGKHQSARRYARAWPDEKLAPVIRVRAKQFVDQLQQETLRVRNISESLSELLGSIEDEQRRRQAMQLWIEIKGHLDLNTLPRFAPYELFSLDDGLAAESKLALAATGWLLGPDSAFDEFPAAVGLLQIRYLLMDYLQTADDDDTERNRLLQAIRTQEGFSVERVASLIRHLPPSDRLGTQPGSLDPRVFTIDGSGSMAGCTGQLPAEYADTVKYPVVIAFSRSGGSSASTLQWWGQQANRHGFIVVVPELYSSTDGNYDASAEQHQKFLALMRELKSSLSLDDDRIFIAGHGIGGEAAMDIGTAHPSLFAGLISVSGLGRKHIQWTAHNSLTLPWYVVVGTRQPFYYKRMELLLRKLFQRSNPTREYCDVLLARYAERGFESYAEELPNVFRWMNLQRRTSPTQINAAILRSTDLDWYWLGVNSIPERFASLDQPSTPEIRPAAQSRLSAQISGNLIRITTIPADGFVRLSPDLPDIDFQKPITIRFGSSAQRVDYDPSTRDLLEDFRIYRDRSRLCFMKVPFTK